MDYIDKLFDKISNFDDSKIIKYKSKWCLIRLIYMCLKYRYCYQIGATQQVDWVSEIGWLLLNYGPGELDDYGVNESIDFFHEGEALENIYLEVVNFMENYQGYKDLPRDKDTIYKFARDNICKGADESIRFFDTITRDPYKYQQWKESCFIYKWVCKYARGNRIKEEIELYF